MLLQDKSDLEAAIEAIGRPSRSKPDYAEAYNNMGSAPEG